MKLPDTIRNAISLAPLGLALISAAIVLSAAWASSVEQLEARVARVASAAQITINRATVAATTTASTLENARRSGLSAEQAVARAGEVSTLIGNASRILNTIVILDRDGATLRNSRFGVRPGRPVETRDFFTGLIEGDMTRPYLSEAFFGRVTRAGQFGVSVAARDPEGRLSHVATATVMSADLENMMRVIVGVGDVRSALVHPAGTLLARDPPLAGETAPAGALVAGAARAAFAAPDLRPRVQLARDGGLRWFLVGGMALRDRNVAAVLHQPATAAMAGPLWTSLAFLLFGLVASALIRMFWRREVAASQAALAAEARARAAERAAALASRQALARTLAGGVAHHFNNLMTVVVGAGETLLDDPDLPAPARRSAETLLVVGERGARLADALRLAAATDPTEAREIDLCAQVRAVAARRREALAEAGSEVALAGPLASSPPLRAICDPRAIELSLERLIDNALAAIDAGAGPGRIELTLSRGPGKAMVTVEDDGAGMTDEVLARARDPFFTTHFGKVGSDAGLGLAIVDGLMSACGGGMEIDSSPGAGTRVTLWARAPVDPPA